MNNIKIFVLTLIEQSVISASAYNGNDTEGLLNAMQDALKEDIGLDEAVGIMTGQVVYKYEEEQEND